MVARSAEGIAMAKKKAGRPKSANPRGKGRQVRMDPDIVAKADIVTRRRGIETGPYLSKLVEAAVNRDYAAVLRELAELEGSK
jgi:hypothetical protein